MFLPARPHGGNLEQASRRYKKPKEEFLDFSSNINPLGPSPMALSAISSNLAAVVNYPDPDCTELKSALSTYLGLPEEHLVIGNGAAELIYSLAQAARIKRAVIPVPTFIEYGLAVVNCGGEVLEINMPASNGFCLPVAEIISCLEDADALFLCNPNNPTGRLLPGKVVVHLVRAALDKGTTVIVDEAFMDFIPSRSCHSVMGMVGEYPNLVVLYSMTKFFGIPGLRLGAMAGPVEIIEAVKTARAPWTVNTLAQVAGVASLRDIRYMEETRQIVVRERKFLYRQLSKIPGIKPLPAAANFILIDVTKSGFTSGQITDILGEKGILVRNCEGFAGLDRGGYIRIAVRTRAENEKLLYELKNALEGE